MVCSQFAAIPEPSSLQCLDCHSGFNINFSTTNLETIFYWYLHNESVPEPDTTTTKLHPKEDSHSEGSPQVKANVVEEVEQCAPMIPDKSFVEWSRDVTQWRATQEFWQRKQRGNNSRDTDQQSALDILLDKIDGKNPDAQTESTIEDDDNITSNAGGTSSISIPPYVVHIQLYFEHPIHVSTGL